MRALCSFCVLMITVFPASGRGETLRIFGQSVEVTDVSYRKNSAGLKIAHSAKLKAETLLAFPRGNRIRFAGEVFFHDNGNLWMAEPLDSTNVLSWISASGQNVSLNCGMPPNVNGITMTKRYVTFYPSGEYGSGCRFAGTGALRSAQGDFLTPNAATAIDLDEKGYLKYVASLKRGRLRYLSQDITLLINSEVGFHENGHPSFFFMTPDSRLKINSHRFGPMVLAQRDKNPLFIQFTDRGDLEHGMLGLKLKVKNVELPVGTVLAFERLDEPQIGSDGQDLRDWAAVLPSATSHALSSNTIFVSKFLFGKRNDVIGATTSSPFEFHSPEGDVFHVPAGSRLYLTDGVIIRIDLPMGSS